MLADWLIAPGIRGSPARSSIAFGRGCWAAVSSTSRTTSDPTTRRAIPSCWPTWSRSWSAAHYDLKHVYRLILNSQIYQLSPLSKSKQPEAAANFAAYPLRRLDAEVLIDALCQVTGTTERYASAIPEPYTFIPENQRSIALPDGSISSAFLEEFGRPPATRAWRPSATTGSRPPSGCTCSIPATSA